VSIGALAAVAIVGLLAGIWLGLPGRYEQTPEDIEKIMERGGGRTKKVKRVFTPMAWVERRLPAALRPRQRTRQTFKLRSPRERGDQNSG
jgi:hypothetical protein